jgi:SAM-dependent methyltransferase
MHRTRVSNFRPTVARALLDRYSGPGDAALDFSAGYGGRLLGALTLERAYTGVDPSSAQIYGLKSMTATFLSHSRGNASIIQGCAEEVLPTLGEGRFSVALSSPPYFNCERYSEEATQSYLRYPLYQDWKERFLNVVLGESHRVLAKGGYLLLNVANSGRVSVASDAEEICRRYFGRPRRILQMLIASGPKDRSRVPASVYRSEPIFVFKKA